MNKADFLSKLESSLHQISEAERRDILQDFEEHFQIGLAEGKSEEDIVAGLGSPDHIAKELLANYHIEKVETKASAGNMLRAVWSVIGLGFFNLVVVLGPFLALVGILLAGWIVSITFVASPILVLVNTLIHPSVFEAFELFVSLVLSGLGFFIGIGMYYVTRWLSKVFVRYLRSNVNFVKGGLKYG